MSSFIALDPLDPRPVYQQIADGLRGALLSGGLREGDAIPSVRELARELRVNPNTVHHAYRELERGGMIRVERGMGSFVCAEPTEADRRATRAEVARTALRLAAAWGMTGDDLLEAIGDSLEGRSSRRTAAA